jgi:SRSO17 transposase
VSVHAVGKTGTVPLGWALYLPEGWCEDAQRRRKAKIPDEVVFKTKVELAGDLVERASGWAIPRAPVLGDHDYGRRGKLRARLDQAGCEYVLSVGPEPLVFEHGTTFERKTKRGGVRKRPRPDRTPEPLGELIARLGQRRAQTVNFRDGPDGQAVSSSFILTRVHVAHAPGEQQHGPRRPESSPDAELPPREEWLIAEWPAGAENPTGYWLSNLPADTTPERLARLARLRWKIELDYKQLKGELGLDHYEGRSWLGWYHHTALVTAAHGFLTLERLNPFHPRPA